MFRTCYLFYTLAANIDRIQLWLISHDQCDNGKKMYRLLTQGLNAIICVSMER